MGEWLPPSQESQKVSLQEETFRTTGLYIVPLLMDVTVAGHLFDDASAVHIMSRLRHIMTLLVQIRTGCR